MALSLNDYIEKTTQQYTYWQQEADLVEQGIDKTLVEAIVTNIIPDKKNPNFVCRYKFSSKVTKAVKDLLRMKYGQLGWTIKENVDFKDFNVNGYFDFFKEETK